MTVSTCKNDKSAERWYIVATSESVWSVYINGKNYGSDWEKQFTQKDGRYIFHATFKGDFSNKTNLTLDETDIN